MKDRTLSSRIYCIFSSFRWNKPLIISCINNFPDLGKPQQCSSFEWFLRISFFLTKHQISYCSWLKYDSLMKCLSVRVTAHHAFPAIGRAINQNDGCFRRGDMRVCMPRKIRENVNKTWVYPFTAKASIIFKLNCMKVIRGASRKWAYAYDTILTRNDVCLALPRMCGGKQGMFYIIQQPSNLTRS